MQYKYTIKDYFKEKNTRFKATIIINLGVSKRTFDRWVNIPYNSKKSIPFDAALEIAANLNIDVNSLVTINEDIFYTDLELYDRIEHELELQKKHLLQLISKISFR